MSITIFYTLFPSKEIASEVIKILLDEKLIACGNVVPSDSLYIWLGELTSENEYIGIMKTLHHKCDAVMSRIASLHPYEVPAILHWQVEANDSYYKWVESVLE